MAEKFSYTYSPNAKNEVEAIRQKYLFEPRKEESEKLTQLKKLDKKVELPGLAVSLALGIFGTFLVALGIYFISHGIKTTLGIALNVAGLAIDSITPALNSAINKKRRKKYAEEIFRLSEEIV